jgi:hypothetical protein
VTGGRSRISVLLVAGFLLVPAGGGLAAQRASAPAEFARRVVTVAVDLPTAGLAFRVEPAPGARLIGESAGTLDSRRLHLSFHLSERVPAGRYQVATVRAGGVDFPVVVDVEGERSLHVTFPATIAVTEGGRDSVIAYVINRGNARERVDLSARSGPGVSVSIARAVELGPGDTARVVVGLRAQRGAAPGSVRVEARAGEVVAARSAAYTVTTGSAKRSLPLAVQGVGGEGGMRLSVRAEGRWNDSVQYRLNLGQRARVGEGALLWPSDPRGLWAAGPSWSVTLGEVRRRGTLLEPAVSGLGADARWGRARGWQVSATVARPAQPVGSGGADGAMTVERQVEGTRVWLSGASARGWWGDRLSVVALGARSAGGTGPGRWSAGLGVAHSDSVFLPVGSLSGSVARGPLRLQGEVARSAAPRFDGVRSTYSGTVQAEVVQGGFSAFAAGSAREEEGRGDVRAAQSASIGIRVRGGAASMELRGGWQGAEGLPLASGWSAALAGATVRLPVGSSHRLSVVREQWWAEGTARDHTSARVEWVSRQGTAWLQATRGALPSPYPLPNDVWHFGGGGRFENGRWSAAASASLDVIEGRWGGSGYGELALRARQDTDLLIGTRHLGWTSRRGEVHAGIRRRLGLPVPVRRRERTREAVGALVVRVAFAEARAGAVEVVPRGSVRLHLAGGGHVEAPLDADGRVVFSYLPAGRYAAEHLPPDDAAFRRGVEPRPATVDGGGEAELALLAGYLPRGMQVVQLDSGAAALPQAVDGSAPPRVAAVPIPSASGRSCGTGVLVPGMTEADVVCILGPPAVRRERGIWTYLIYPGACEGRGRCAHDDVVFLRASRVVTAYIVGHRRYVGPAPAEALRAHPLQ